MYVCLCVHLPFAFAFYGLMLSSSENIIFTFPVEICCHNEISTVIDFFFAKHCYEAHHPKKIVGIMDNSSLMPSFYREEANKLLAKYYPIEIDPKMSEEEKIPYMIEWYSQIHELIIKCKVSQKSLEEMVTRSNARLR